MVEDKCCSCGKEGTFELDYNRGTHVALVCSECGKWIKWVGKKEIPIYERYFSKRNNSSVSRFDSLEKALKSWIERECISKADLLYMINKISE